MSLGKVSNAGSLGKEFEGLSVEQIKEKIVKKFSKATDVMRMCLVGCGLKCITMKATKPKGKSFGVKEQMTP